MPSSTQESPAKPGFKQKNSETFLTVKADLFEC